MGLLALVDDDFYRGAERVVIASVANGDKVVAPVLLKLPAAWHAGLYGPNDFHVRSPVLWVGQGSVP